MFIPIVSLWGKEATHVLQYLHFGGNWSFGHVVSLAPVLDGHLKKV